VSLLTDLDAFSTEHIRCGDLDGGVDGDIVWFACDCGARSPGAWRRMTMPACADVAAAIGRRRLRGRPRRRGCELAQAMPEGARKVVKQNRERRR
jgi:hypothetical protein